MDDGNQSMKINQPMKITIDLSNFWWYILNEFDGIGVF